MTGAYLHADDRIDEEQHGNEEGDVGQCLQERKMGSDWPLALELLRCKTFIFPFQAQRTQRVSLNLCPAEGLQWLMRYSP